MLWQTAANPFQAHRHFRMHLQVNRPLRRHGASTTVPSLTTARATTVVPVLKVIRAFSVAIATTVARERAQRASATATLPPSMATYAAL